MIITHISAENVLKYRNLELTDLPGQGLITISGKNESGKSSIGETVCFALFGRTFSIDEDSVDRVIRWGETRCSVHMGFIAGDVEYEIARFLDAEGNHGVRLYRAGEEEHPLARGVQAVSDELHSLLGYQYEEFVESFYLAQREITTPHPHSHAVKTMAGIAALEQVADEFAAEIESEQQRIPDLSDQIDTVNADIHALEIDAGLLPDLEDQLSQVKLAEAELQTRQIELDHGLQEYQQALPRLMAARSKKRFTGFLSLLFLLAALAAGATWYLLSYMPDSPAAAGLRDMAVMYVPQWQAQDLLQLGMVAIICTIAFVVFWLLARSFGRRVKEQGSRGEELANLLIQVASLPQHDAATQQVDKPAEIATDVVEDGGKEAEAVESADIPAAADDSSSSEIRLHIQPEASTWAALKHYAVPVDTASELVRAAQQTLQQILQHYQGQHDQLAEAISKEQARYARAETLQEVVDSLSSKLDQHQYNITLREIGDDLLKGAARHISHRFNRDLRELASGTLPLFTEQRYEHVQIDDDLNVRVFSNKKHDFMDLDEISSGTQRQIMLAVRLALSQELVNTTIGGAQFVFLDEPFAFFDQARTRSSMAVLPRLSDEIQQIWVIAQEFPEGTDSDLAIVCSREYDNLPPAADEA